MYCSWQGAAPGTRAPWARSARCTLLHDLLDCRLDRPLRGPVSAAKGGGSGAASPGLQGARHSAPGAYMPGTRAQTTIPLPKTPNLQNQQPAADSYIITSLSSSQHRSPSHSHPAAAILESNTRRFFLLSSCLLSCLQQACDQWHAGLAVLELRANGRGCGALSML